MADTSRELDEASHEILETLSEAAQPIAMPSALADDAYRLSLRDLVMAMVHEFGGSTGVGCLLKSVFEKAPPGSQAQTSILTLLFKGLERFGEESGEDDRISMRALEQEYHAVWLEELLAKLSKGTRAAVLREVS